jgi:hypothetical protein
LSELPLSEIAYEPVRPVRNPGGNVKRFYAAPPTICRQRLPKP